MYPSRTAVLYSYDANGNISAINSRLSNNATGTPLSRSGLQYPGSSATTRPAAGRSTTTAA
jgi:hypothetical protein